MNIFRILATSILHVCFIFTLFFIVSNNSALAANNSPAILITEIKVENKITKVSGTVSDDLTPATEITLEVLDSANNLIGTAITLEDNNWTFEKELPNNVHTLYVKATDTDTPPNSTQLEFTVDSLRPRVTEINVELFNYDDPKMNLQANLLENESMTRVLVGTKFLIKLTDNEILDPQNMINPVTIFNKNGPVEGTTFFNKENQTLEFTLTSDLMPSTSYYIIVNPKLLTASTLPTIGALTDSTGNSVFPIIKKFTTVSETVSKPYQTNLMTDLHGNYISNVNTCVNCHSTHVSSAPKMIQPKNEYTSKNQISKDNYCMACHDGTAAPMAENTETGIASKHETNLSSEHLTQAGSCTACHNPHLTWNKENPNLLNDHYIVENHPKVAGVAGDMFDSAKMLCETCHDAETKILKEFIPKKHTDPTVKYKILHYRQYSTGLSNSSDFDLCFRCHNGDDSIEEYYSSQSNGHNLTNLNGSSLNGSIPCTECHETHRASNIKLLKNKLGHENQQESFTAPSGEWNPTLERQFCLKCHNNSTAIYGVTGGLNTEISPDHAVESNEACSSCHGGASKSSKEAAHAPK